MESPSAAPNPVLSSAEFTGGQKISPGLLCGDSAARPDAFRRPDSGGPPDQRPRIEPRQPCLLTRREDCPGHPDPR